MPSRNERNGKVPAFTLIMTHCLLLVAARVQSDSDHFDHTTYFVETLIEPLLLFQQFWIACPCSILIEFHERKSLD